MHSSIEIQIGFRLVSHMFHTDFGRKIDKIEAFNVGCHMG